MTTPAEDFIAICPVCNQEFDSQFPIPDGTICEACFLEEAEADEQDGEEE